MKKVFLLIIVSLIWLGLFVNLAISPEFCIMIDPDTDNPLCQFMKELQDDITDDCPSGYCAYGVFDNGTIKCVSCVGIGNVSVDIWVNETGDKMTGNLNMTKNNITDVSDLFVDNIHGGSDITVYDNIFMANQNITGQYFIGGCEYLTNCVAGFSNATQDIYVNETGDTMTGNLTVPYIIGSGAYLHDVNSSLRTHESSNVLSISGGVGFTTTTETFDYLITQIMVYPTSASNTYNFQATENTTGYIIDRDRINHAGNWIILKDYAVETDRIDLNITNASIDESFTVKIRYMI